jgi:glycosyltransferase involved in cell wall biosynthesis
MKVSVLARPDHSIALVEGLRALGVDVDYHTFFAFREKGLLSRLAPNRKTVPADAHAHLLFTALAYPLALFTRGLPYNHRAAEKRLGDLLLRPSIANGTDVVHYWPFYFADRVRQLKAARPDVLTIAEYYEAEPTFANAQFRTAYEQAGLPFERPFNELIDQNVAFSFETNFVVPSEFVRASYQRRYPNASIHVVDYGMVGMKLAQAPRPTAARTRWVCVGHVSLEKGVHVLLDVMEREPQLQLDLIGPIVPTQRAYIERRLAKVPNVRYVGHLRRSQVLERLPQYDAFVMPSLSDAYSLPAIEALCAGLPLVLTDHNGVSDVVRRHDLGEVVPTGSADALRAAMRRVTESTDTERLASGLRAFAKRESDSPYASRVLALYERLLSSTSKVARHG